MPPGDPGGLAGTGQLAQRRRVAGAGEREAPHEGGAGHLHAGGRGQDVRLLGEARRDRGVRPRVGDGGPRLLDPQLNLQGGELRPWDQECVEEVAPSPVEIADGTAYPGEQQLRPRGHLRTRGGHPLPPARLTRRRDGVGASLRGRHVPGRQQFAGGIETKLVGLGSRRAVRGEDEVGGPPARMPGPGSRGKRVSARLFRAARGGEMASALPRVGEGAGQPGVQPASDVGRKAPDRRVGEQPVPYRDLIAGEGDQACRDEFRQHPAHKRRAHRPAEQAQSGQRLLRGRRARIEPVGDDRAQARRARP